MVAGYWFSACLCGHASRLLWLDLVWLVAPRSTSCTRTSQQEPSISANRWAAAAAAALGVRDALQLVVVHIILNSTDLLRWASVSPASLVAFDQPYLECRLWCPSSSYHPYYAHRGVAAQRAKIQHQLLYSSATHLHTTSHHCQPPLTHLFNLCLSAADDTSMACVFMCLCSRP